MQCYTVVGYMYALFHMNPISTKNTDRSDWALCCALIFLNALDCFIRLVNSFCHILNTA